MKKIPGPLAPPCKLCNFCGGRDFAIDDDYGVYRDDQDIENDYCNYDDERVPDHQHAVDHDLGKSSNFQFNLTLTRRPSRKITALSYSCTT